MEDITREVEKRLRIELPGRYLLFEGIRDLIENYRSVLTYDIISGNIGLMKDIRLIRAESIRIGADRS